uniref:CCAAT/enhancer-binding protein zeta n=1 Tax=Lygus hesperus TaxID=30085 RepID=A0A0A9YDM9_LYGHE
MKNCPLRTMRYTANIMNQFVYSKEERKLALRSVQTYLSLFRQLATSGAADSTVTTAILVGLRRAFPYAGSDMQFLYTHLDALFVLANTGNFQQRIATLSLLHLIVSNKATPDTMLHRWYRALYQLLLLSPKQIPQTTQLTNFFAMLHKAMRSDHSDERVMAFVHRLLQRSLYYNPAMICAILLLVGEIVSTRPRVRTLIRPLESISPPTSLDTHQQANTEIHLHGHGSVREEQYDTKAREPQFAHASRECLWTLNTLSHHYHPSVVKLAVLLLFGE